MSTRKSTFTVLVIYLASLLLVAVPAQAQIPTAAVSITCQPAEIKVDVKPGSTLVGFTTCTASNPTAYIEKIALSVTSDGLAAAAPGDIYVGGGQDEDFQAVVRAQPFMTMQARSLVVQGSVQEINGLPPANQATSGASRRLHHTICTPPSRSSRAFRSTHAKDRQGLRIQGLQPRKPIRLHEGRYFGEFPRSPRGSRLQHQHPNQQGQR